ncbi:MAG TPA: hypothetical protein VGU90_14570 [Terriglobales bacterium]|nr:hypothetical protein [Terriglobales bacterium]
MSDPAITPPPLPTVPDQPTDFDISEEYGTARKNLPPARIVLICVAVVAVIVAVYALTHRAHTVSAASIDEVNAVALPGQDAVLVALNVSIQNNEDKPIWIKTIQATADAGGSKQTDDAAPAVDAQRYVQTFPELKQHALEFLTPESRVNPKGKLAGTIIVSFPVKPDAFASRKSLTVTITPYDEMPIVATK